MGNAEINEIKSQIGQIQGKLADAKDRLRDAQFRATGLTVGQIVMKTSWHSGKDECLVCVKGWGNFGVDSVKIKKDGTAGKQSAGYMKKWRLLTAEEQNALEGK